jgi:hypothetical protein
VFEGGGGRNVSYGGEALLGRGDGRTLIIYQKRILYCGIIMCRRVIIGSPSPKNISL